MSTTSEKKITLEDIRERLDQITGVSALPYGKGCKLPYAHELLWEGPSGKGVWFVIGEALLLPTKEGGTNTIFAMFQNDTEYRVYTLGVPGKETNARAMLPMRFTLSKASPNMMQERFYRLDIYLAEIADEVLALEEETMTLSPGDVLMSDEGLNVAAAKWARERGYVDPEEPEDDEEEEDDEETETGEQGGPPPQ